MSYNDREIIGIAGQTRSGKSEAMRRIIARLRRAIILDPFGHLGGIALPDLAALGDYLEGQPPGAPFRVSLDAGGIGVESDLDYLCRFALAAGDVWLCIDEVDRFGDPRDTPAYDGVIQRGGHRGVSLLTATTHIMSVPVFLRRQTTGALIFRHILAEDINDFSRIVGREAAAAIPQLPDYHAISWSPGADPCEIENLAAGDWASKAFPTTI